MHVANDSPFYQDECVENLAVLQWSHLPLTSKIYSNYNTTRLGYLIFNGSCCIKRVRKILKKFIIHRCYFPVSYCSSKCLLIYTGRILLNSFICSKELAQTSFTSPINGHRCLYSCMYGRISAAISSSI